MTERQELENAMAALDQQRTQLGDASVDAALVGLRQRLAALVNDQPQSSELTGERRVVTVLFCDVKGSTAMAEKLDPEEWAGIMKRAMAFLIPPVTRQDGMVARLMGDAILAFFGAPTTHEDDPQRAVRAGLDILEGIGVFREELKRERGLDFNVRVGIHTGLVFVGAIGADQRAEYTAMGETVNLAARMEQTAQPGSVQISEQTHRLVEPWFVFEALGEIQVKGKSDLVITYRVIGIKTRPARGVEFQGLAVPLVGRGQELQTLEASVQRLHKRGEGGIIGIIGDAGLGKSRLIAEVKALALASFPGIPWLEGQTLSFGQTIAYWPFQQMLRSWAGITEHDSPDTAGAKLEGHVRALFGDETVDYFPYLASLLSLEVGAEYAERVRYLDGDAMGKQIFLTARRFFHRLARAWPTVLIFEDLHWMDESSTRLLEHLLPLVETAPLLIIGLSRPERETPAARIRELCARDFAHHYTEIQLAPLSGMESNALMGHFLDVENLPARLREMIVTKADGNPFFMEEVLRTLIDTGAVQHDAADGRWRATAQIETIQIPNTIQGVIMARVDRLDEELKQVLRMASVIGRSFLFRVLKAIAEAERHLDEDLAELKAIDLIHEKQHLPELEFMFKHALAQETMYESILLQKRRELHARVARAMESLFAGRMEEIQGLLAYHYARAEVWDKALEYLLKAADQAGQISADAEALNLYQQATTAYARTFGDQWDPAQRASLARKMGESFFRRGEYSSALEHFGLALSYLQHPLPKSRREVRLALLRELLIHVGRRLRGPAVLGAQQISQGVEDEVSIYRSISYMDAFANSERALMLLLRMLNLSEQRGYEFGVIFACYGLGMSLDIIGWVDQAWWYHRYAVREAEKLAMPYSLGFAYTGLLNTARCSGKLNEAFEYAERAIRIHHEVGNSFEEAFAASFLAWIAVHWGELVKASARSRELMQIGQDAGARNVWCWGETVMGYTLNRQGDLEQAIVHLQKAIELAEAVPDIIYRIFAGTELGLCYLRQGDPDRALKEFEACLRIREKQNVLECSGYIMTLNNSVEAYLQLAAQSETSQRKNWLNMAWNTLRTALKESPKFPIRSPQTMRLQGTYEWLWGKSAEAHSWWKKSLAEAERMGLRYDAGLVYLEMGRQSDGRAHLEMAEAIFAEIGAELDLANARKLLQRRN